MELIKIPLLKKCKSCFIVKSLDNYHKCKKSRYGVVTECKECRAKYNKQLFTNDKERMLKVRRDYKKNNPIKTKESNAIYAEKNKDEINKRCRESYHKNIDKEKARNKKYRDNNKDKEKARKKRYQQTENYKDVRRRAEFKYRALELSTDDKTITKQSLEDLLSKQNNKCYHCGIELDSKKHLDHFYPLSKGGANSISNVVWSCPHCNLSKGAKMPTTLLLV